jgi:PhnB protein
MPNCKPPRKVTDERKFTTMTSPVLEPYLFLGGRAEEAIEFYRTALKGEVQMKMLYKESPEKSAMPMPPGWENKVMHASVKIGNINLMMSDGCGPNETGFSGFSLSLTLTDEAEAKRVYEALSAGGKAEMPLTSTFFAVAFGMLEDRFGIGWMVMVPRAM